MEYFCLTSDPENFESDVSTKDGVQKQENSAHVSENNSSTTCGFFPPTNQASHTRYHGVTSHPRPLTESNEVTETSDSLPTPTHSPCLPVSKGSIKKMAQTRFANSSPRSYRLMPASVESSDMTSFVEKTPHKYAFPVSFMLDVAELWELSKHSELECVFTSANSDTESISKKLIEDAKQKSPICHSSVVPAHVPCPWRTGSRQRILSNDYTDCMEENKLKVSAANAGIGTDLLRNVKRFLQSQRLKEQHPMGIAGFVKPASSLKRFVSSNSAGASRIYGKHKLDSKSEDTANDSLSPLVKLLTVNSSNESQVAENGQVFIIQMFPAMEMSSSEQQTKPKHITTMSALPKTADNDEPPLKRSRPVQTLEADAAKIAKNDSNKGPETSSPSCESQSSNSKYECFYCNQEYVDKNSCARHMLVHLASDSCHIK